MNDNKRSKKNDEFLRKIGARIKELRKSQGLSQKAFADKIDMEFTNLSRLENGRHNLSVLRLKTICDEFGLALGEFLTDLH